jgi:hypothetical protein
MLLDESRGGYRYQVAGRKRLSRLGAWPWCLRDSGRLPPRWYSEEEFARALAIWHYQQTLATFATTFRSFPSAAPRTAVATFDAAVREFALDMYRQWYTAWVQAPGDDLGVG